MEYLNLLWQFAQTGPGLMIIGFVILWLLNKLYEMNPALKKYEGFLIHAIKGAEKWIPNDTDNEILSKTDKALDLFSKAYTKAKGKAPTKKMLQKAAEAMPVVHNKLEKDGTLTKVKKKAG